MCCKNELNACINEDALELGVCRSSHQALSGYAVYQTGNALPLSTKQKPEAPCAALVDTPTIVSCYNFLERFGKFLRTFVLKVLGLGDLCLVSYGCYNFQYKRDYNFHSSTWRTKCVDLLRNSYPIAGTWQT